MVDAPLVAKIESELKLAEDIQTAAKTLPDPPKEEAEVKVKHHKNEKKHDIKSELFQAFSFLQHSTSLWAQHITDQCKKAHEQSGEMGLSADKKLELHYEIVRPITLAQDILAKYSDHPILAHLKDRFPALDDIKREALAYIGNHEETMKPIVADAHALGELNGILARGVTGSKFKNLVVVNFLDRGKNSIPGNKNWFQTLFMPHTCSRHLLITTKELWDKMAPEETVKMWSMSAEDEAQRVLQEGDPSRKPGHYFNRSEKPYYHKEEGMKAYEMLLNIASGLESKHLGEEQIHGQIADYWHSYQHAHVQNAKGIASVVDTVLEDSRLIHREILKSRVQPRREMVAKRLSGVGHQNVAVIFAPDPKEPGQKTRKGEEKSPLEALKEMANALGKENRDSVEEIVVLHPDKEYCETIRQALKTMQDGTELVKRWSVEPIDAENPEWNETLQEAVINEAKAFFVLQPLGRNPEYDDMIKKFMIDRNKDARHKKASLVVMENPRLEEDETNPIEAWKKELPDNFTVIEQPQIHEALAKAEIEFADALGKARNGVKNCITSHIHNKHAYDQKIGMDPEEYRCHFLEEKAALHRRSRRDQVAHAADGWALGVKPDTNGEAAGAVVARL